MLVDIAVSRLRNQKLVRTDCRVFRAGRIVIALQTFRPLAADERRRLDVEAERLGKFARMQVVVERS